MRSLRTIEATLPSGMHVKLREPKGSDELAAQTDAAKYGAENRLTVATWSVMMRCTVEIDGKAPDQTKLTPEIYRDLFDVVDWNKATELWVGFYELSKAQEDAFQGSKRLGTV